ncbi:exonuclease domain-containing protein [Flavobacterium amniphilum]|uniref:exonuclease domain-containing protein n=1 Tax=Flavobacterium amniphilum TaxID=1834035 RepID=UPI002029E96F|nr:exonuclease domain-containing protein [Flavobacterium amniphilum]MCL9804286.1 exonuclease domain-containing protein [Flavobacterium amniphilum]
MLDWIKNIGKDYPDFWKNYIAQFEQTTNRKVVIYLETTGINPSKDRIISIGAVTIDHGQILLEKSLEIELNKEAVQNEKDLIYEEIQAIETLINFIGNATLVGHRIHYDIEILNEYLHKLHSGRLKNDLLDVEVMHGKIIDQTNKQYSLLEIFNAYKVVSPDITTSANYAFSIAMVYLKMKSKLKLN